MLACSELGLMLIDSEDLERDYPKAAALQKMSCDAGLVAGCFHLAELRIRSEVGIDASSEQEKIGAVADIRKICDNGYLDACDRLGAFAVHGIGTPKNPLKGRILLEQGCNAGRMYACNTLVEILEGRPEKDLGITSTERQKYKKHYVDARRTLSRALCEQHGMYCFLGTHTISELQDICKGRGVISACTNAGIGHLLAYNTIKDPVQAAHYFEMACPQNSGRSCYELGLMYRAGDAVGKDVRRAFVYLERSCELGVALGCYYLGEAYLNGKGVESNLQKSLEVRRRACSWHSPVTCKFFGRWLVLHDGNEVPAENGKREGLEALERACDGDEDACMDVVFMHDRGWGTPKDPVKARELGQSYCDNGYPGVCVWLENPANVILPWVKERDAIERRRRK